MQCKTLLYLFTSEFSSLPKHIVVTEDHELLDITRKPMAYMYRVDMI